MKMFIKNHKRSLLQTITIFLCFFLTSVGYLGWLYRLIDLVPSGAAELLSMGAGYLLQAAGIGIFSIILYKRAAWIGKSLFAGAAVGYFFCAVPAMLAVSLPAVLVFGFVSNLICGVIAGLYLYMLDRAEPAYRGRIFGIGYGLASVASWLLTLFASQTVYSSVAVLPLLAAVTAFVVSAVCRSESFALPENSAPAQERIPLKKILPFVCVIVFLFSAVNQIGFSFPASDIGSRLYPELLRLFYAAGLIIAGIVNDIKRKYGAVLTLCALIIPFVSLGLKNEPLPAAVFWALGYFAAGFFSVFRVAVFADLAEKYHLWYLAGFGLLFGRCGEAAGAFYGTVVSGSVVLLVAAAAILYVVTLVLFWPLYQRLYLPRPDPEKEERLRFQRFALQHDLSPREKEILTLLLKKETTPVIAGRLFVSESTVKFHVHNLLQKTGCKSRKDLIDLFRSAQ